MYPRSWKRSPCTTSIFPFLFSAPFWFSTLAITFLSLLLFFHRKMLNEARDIVSFAFFSRDLSRMVFSLRAQIFCKITFKISTLLAFSNDHLQQMILVLNILRKTKRFYPHFHFTFFSTFVSFFIFILEILIRDLSSACGSEVATPSIAWPQKISILVFLRISIIIFARSYFRWIFFPFHRSSIWGIQAAINFTDMSTRQKLANPWKYRLKCISVRTYIRRTIISEKRLKKMENSQSA